MPVDRLEEVYALLARARTDELWPQGPAVETSVVVPSIDAETNARAYRELSALQRQPAPETLTTACSTDPSPAGARDAALVALLYGGGLRRSEAVALDLVDYEAETGQLTTRKSKGNRPRVCWVTNGSSLALADWLAVRGDEPGPFFMAVGKGGRVSQDRSSGRAVHVVLQRRARQAGVTRLTPQDLRRSFVSDLLERGADLSVVSKLAGHAGVGRRLEMTGEARW